MKTYYAHLKVNNEKTGDYVISECRLKAAEFFSQKKLISLKDWLSLYSIPK